MYKIKTQYIFVFLINSEIEREQQEIKEQEIQNKKPYPCAEVSRRTKPCPSLLNPIRFLSLRLLV